MCCTSVVRVVVHTRKIQDRGGVHPTSLSHTWRLPKLYSISCEDSVADFEATVAVDSLRARFNTSEALSISEGFCSSAASLRPTALGFLAVFSRAGEGRAGEGRAGSRFTISLCRVSRRGDSERIGVSLVRIGRGFTHLGLDLLLLLGVSSVSLSSPSEARGTMCRPRFSEATRLIQSDLPAELGNLSQTRPDRRSKYVF